MPVEVVVGFLVTAITVLSGAVAFLFRQHLNHDGQRDGELEAWKAIALSGSKSLGDLVPAVGKLTTAVEVEHRVASEGRDDDRNFRQEWRALATEVRDNVREVAPPRRRRPT